MGTCIFKTSELKRCIEHALASTQWRKTYSDEGKGPGLWFVHDSGVYLMSNGFPIDKREASEDDKSSYVVYAEGCHPGIDDGSWEYARSLVGGDDFGECIPIDDGWSVACDLHEEFHVKVAADSLTMTWAKPKRKKPAKKQPAKS